MKTAVETLPAYRFEHLTIPAPTGVEVSVAVKAMYVELVARLADQRIAPLQEKVYGPLEVRDEVLRIRREVVGGAGFDADLPCTYTTGRRDDHLGLTGVQLWGVVGRPDAAVSVRTVHASNGVSGRLMESPGQRLLHLGAVPGISAREPSGGVAEQAARMFAQAEAGLAEYGFGFDQVARTWIYLGRLLDWYGEFNRVRTAFLRERGFGGAATDAAFPASTGIQGTSGAGECVMDLLAVDGPGLRVTPVVDTSRQHRPIAYGSSFSRGMVLGGDADRTVFVSGTASIDACGQTLYCWQRESQVVETLLSIAALLEDQGGSLRDIVSATLFCKDRQTLEIYRRLHRQLGIPRFPTIPVLADVCRPELMVEIEAMASLPGMVSRAAESRGAGRVGVVRERRP
jgi:enamine deaminase RidA (YjgF/YER057c/UK114 family)